MPPIPLTAREREILTMLADGHTGRQAARELGISLHTLRWHTDSARAKLGARTIAHAVALFHRDRLIDAAAAA